MTANRDTARPLNAADYALPAAALSGVRSRRIFAIMFDLIILSILVFGIVLVLAILGLPTLGLTWLLIPVLLSLLPFIALIYNGLTISGRRLATPGMAMMDLEMRMTDGTRVSFLIAAVHAVLFYVSVTFLTPFILLVSVISLNKRCLHDMFSGVVVTRRQS